MKNLIAVLTGLALIGLGVLSFSNSANLLSRFDFDLDRDGPLLIGKILIGLTVLGGIGYWLGRSK